MNRNYFVWLQAFSFCLKYNRKTEFRKLCDKLRKHLEDISKLPAQTANVSIHKPETQQLNLDTRLVQLDSAIQMELWQVLGTVPFMLIAAAAAAVITGFKCSLTISP
jgi:hypothetical protein